MIFRVFLLEISNKNVTSRVKSHVSIGISGKITIAVVAIVSLMVYGFVVIGDKYSPLFRSINCVDAINDLFGSNPAE